MHTHAAAAHGRGARAVSARHRARRGIRAGLGGPGHAARSSVSSGGARRRGSGRGGSRQPHRAWNWRRISPMRTSRAAARCRICGATTRPASNSKRRCASIRNLFDAYYYYGRASFAAGDIEKSVELWRKAGRSPPARISRVRCCRRSRCACSGGSTKRGAVNGKASGARNSSLALNPLERPRAVTRRRRTCRGRPDRARAANGRARARSLYPGRHGRRSSTARACDAAGPDTKRRSTCSSACSRKGWGKRDWMEHDPDYDSCATTRGSSR